MHGSFQWDKVTDLIPIPLQHVTVTVPLNQELVNESTCDLDRKSDDQGSSKKKKKQPHLGALTIDLSFSTETSKEGSYFGRPLVYARIYSSLVTHLEKTCPPTY